MKGLWLVTLFAVAALTSAAERSTEVDITVNPKLLFSSMKAWGKVKQSAGFTGYVVKSRSNQGISGRLGLLVPLPFGRASDVCGKGVTMPFTNSWRKPIRSIEQMFALLIKVYNGKLCGKATVTFQYNLATGQAYPSFTSLDKCKRSAMNGEYDLGVMLMLPKTLPKQMSMEKLVCAMTVFSVLQHGGADVLKQIFSTSAAMATTITPPETIKAILLDTLRQLKSGDVKEYTSAVTGEHTGNDVDGPTDVYIINEDGFADTLHTEHGDVYSVDEAGYYQNHDLLSDDHPHHRRHHHHRHNRVTRILFFVGSGLLGLTVLYTLYCAIRSCQRQAHAAPTKGGNLNGAPTYCELIEENDEDVCTKLPPYSAHSGNSGPVAV